MTDLQVRLEIAFVLGTRHEEMNKELAKHNKEMLLDSFEDMVEEIAVDFEAWQKDKDESKLQLLHDYIDGIDMPHLMERWGA